METLRSLLNEAEKNESRVRPAKGRWEKRHPSEVLQYTQNKRTGGKIKDGYRAFYDFDGTQKEITSIRIKGRPTDREYALGQRPHDQRDIMTKSLDKVTVFKEKLTKVL